MFHRKKLHSIADNEEPEIVRAPLMQLCLQVFILHSTRIHIPLLIVSRLNYLPKDSKEPSMTSYQRLWIPLLVMLFSYANFIILSSILLSNTNFSQQYQSLDPFMLLQAKMKH